jgi:hypothetical protein
MRVVLPLLLSPLFSATLASAGPGFDPRDARDASFVTPILDTFTRTA